VCSVFGVFCFVFLLIYVCLERSRTEAKLQDKKDYDKRYDAIFKQASEQNAKTKLEQGEAKKRLGLSHFGFQATQIVKAVVLNDDDAELLTPEIRVGLAETTMFLYDHRSSSEPADDLDRALDFMK
jgi:hypothetical protein